MSTTAALTAARATPRPWSTPRDPSRPSTGPRVAALAALLGAPLTWYQLEAAMVAGELDPDGRYRYRKVLLRMPRRAGKTALMLPTLLARAMEQTGRRCWYTAHKREAAARTFREEWAPPVRRLTPHVKVRESIGSEALRVPARRSAVALFAPGPNAIHSADADTVVIDEAWRFTLEAGQVLEQGIRPAMTGLARTPQLWIVTAGGTAASTYLDSYTDAAAGLQDPTLCVVDYSADPATDDLEDPATLDRVHPGLGVTVDRAAVLADRATMPRADWLRAYLCVSAGAADATVPAWPADQVTAAVDPAAVAPTRGVCLALEAALDRSAVAVVAAAPTATRRVHVELVETVPAYAAAERVAALARRYGAPVAAADYGPTAAVVDALRRRGHPVTGHAWPGVARASAALFDALAAGAVVLPEQAALLQALTGARRRVRGESWAVLGGDLPAAVATAATLAHDAARIATARPVVARAG